LRTSSTGSKVKATTEASRRSHAGSLEALDTPRQGIGPSAWLLEELLQASQPVDFRPCPARKSPRLSCPATTSHPDLWLRPSLVEAAQRWRGRTAAIDLPADQPPVGQGWPTPCRAHAPGTSCT
jgi:hypothetical protein